jgi:hypothetical protein
MILPEISLFFPVTIPFPSNEEVSDVLSNVHLRELDGKTSRCGLF